MSPKDDLTLDDDLADVVEAADEIDLNSPVGLGLSVSPKTTTRSPTTPKSAASAASATSTGSNVRSRAAMWENKGDKDTNSKAKETRPPIGGRKRSGTVTRGAAAAGRGSAVSARAINIHNANNTTNGKSNGNGIGSDSLGVSSPPRSIAGSPATASPPSSFKSATSAVSVGGTSPTKPSGMKALRLASRASPTSSPTPPVPSIPIDRSYSRSPKPELDSSPKKSRSPLSSPEKPSSLLTPPKDDEDAPSPVSLARSVSPERASFRSISPEPTRASAVVAAQADTMFLHSVDLDEPEEKAEAKGLELSPRKSFKGIAIEMPPAEPQPQPAEEEEEDVNLDTIDLNGPSDEVEVAQVIRRVVSKESIDIDLASAEPETVVTPASPVHKPAPYEALSPTSSVSPISPVSEKPLPVPVQESSHLSPAASTPGTPGFADIPLTPAAVGGAPTSPGPTRMASLFTRVLDYGKQAQTTQTPPKAPVSEEKKLPETPTPSKQPAAGGKSFFTSFNLPSLPPIRAPTMSGMTMPTMPSMGGPSPEPTPPAESPTLSRDSANGMLGEPKPAASTWRATMTNFLASRTSSSNNVPVAPNSSSSTNLLLHRLDDPTSAHDRRISHEFGDTHKLREGFERVRGEMEGAARDIRREIARGEEQPEDGAAGEGIDWTFWGAVVQDYEGVAREQPKELSKAIQQGIPTVIRGPIWQLMSSSKSAELEETYKALLKLTSPHEKAIQKDISRTFPDHKTFKHTGAGQDGLFMVVKAFSLYDRDVGYTQGMAFIVATLLLHMPDEEAFGVLVRLMHSYNLRSHFLPDMPGLHLRLYQFDRLVEDVLPLLHQHLVRKGVKSDMYASQWFMTLFSYRFPLSLVYRVFDIVLAEGIEATLRFALALLKKREDELVQMEFDEILAVLQGDLFESYRAPESAQSDAVGLSETEWLTNDFVRDAYAIHITPLMLDHYEAEWQEKCRAEDERTREVEQLRAANRHLSTHVKTLEASLATMNNEHVEIVRQLVLAKIAKEDMENELVKYKSMCARLSQQLADEDSGSGPHAAYESGTASLYTGSSHHSSYAQPAAQHLDTLTAVKSNGSAYSTGSRTSRSASPLSPPR